MVDHTKPIIRGKLNHMISHVETNDIPSDKDAGDIAKSIADLTISAKLPTSDVSISNIITRREIYQHKDQELNNHLKEVCTNKNTTLIDHKKNIKQQHLSKSKLHLTKRVTNILSISFVREIQNILR